MSLPLSAALALGIVSLQPGVWATRTISSGEVQSFQLVASAQRFVHGEVDQGDVDLTITLVAPDGRRLGVYDQRDRGSELVSFFAEDRGVYVLEVRAVSTSVRRATYRVQFEAERPKRPDDDLRLEAEALATEARQLFKKGDLRSLGQAIERRKRVLPLWQALGERGAELATLVGTGDALYRLSEYADADVAYHRALSLSRGLNDRRTEAETLTKLAATARPRGNVSEALELLERALDLWRALPFAYGEAVALSNQGVLLRESGEYDAARQRYARALTIFRSLRARQAEAYALNNQAIVLEALGERREALLYLGRAASLFRQVADRKAEGRALVSRARIQLDLGNRPASLTSVRQALPMLRRSGDRLAEADALEHMGRVYDASGDRLQARAEFNNALGLYRAVGSRRGESDALHDSGVSYLLSGNSTEAITFLEQALAVRRAIGLRSLEAETLVRLSEAERASGNLLLARGRAEAAVAIAERLHAGVFERELRTSYFGSVRRYYAEYLAVLMALHREYASDGFAAVALAVAEQAKARELSELLRDSRSDVFAQADERLLKRERELREELNYWSYTLWQQADKTPTSALERTARDKVESLSAEHDDIEADIRRGNPRYAALLQPTPLSLSDIRRAMDGQTVLLEYFLGEQRGYLWAVTADEMVVVDLPKRADVERQVHRFYGLVADRHEGSTTAQSAETRSKMGSALTRLLLSPVSASLAGRRILIVADGALNYLPFAALPAPGHSSPLIGNHEIVMLPSVTTAALLREELAGRAPAPKLLAVLGDPVFDRSDPRVTRQTSVAVGVAERPFRRLTRLPFSRQEAEEIFALSPLDQSLKALDFTASRSVATDPAMKDYRYVHFATHAIRDDRHPELSGLVLSLVNRNGVNQDGFLRLQDLYNLHLQAELVVLSACETGLGRQVNGAGLQTMARGFFYAGAARVMVSLWKVDDEATATLMQLFYRVLFSNTHPTPEAALRTAQLVMSRQARWKDSSYWSGWVLEGAW